MKRTVLLRTTLAIAVAAALVGSSVVLAVPEWRGAFQGRLVAFLEAVRGQPTWGPMIVGAAFVPVCLLFLPGSPLTLFGGFAFGGTFRGLAVVIVCVSIGSTVGATLAFLAGRTIARDWIARAVTDRPAFRVLDAAIGGQGFKIVLLARLSPVFPFNLLNYGLGLTGVSLRDYVLGSWIGMLPGTILYSYLGSTAGELADVIAGRTQRSGPQQAFYFLGLAATLAVTVLITRMARRALAASAPRELAAPPSNLSPLPPRERGRG